MYETLTEHQLAKILVTRDEDRSLGIGPPKHRAIIDAGGKLGDVQNLVPVETKTLDDLPVNAFVSQQIHLTDSVTG